MSFREKSDWCSFISLCTFAIYFLDIAREFQSAGPPRYNYFIYFFVLLGVVVTIQGVTYLVLALRSPQEAKTPADERERLIHLRATRPAYLVFLLGTLLVVGTLHLRFDSWQMAHGLLFVIWVAELTRYGMRLVYYRMV